MVKLAPRILVVGDEVLCDDYIHVVLLYHF